MGVKTGKRWYRVRPPKKSVCVESRPIHKRVLIRKIANWCYKAIYPSPYRRAQECKNLCDPNAAVHPPIPFAEKFALLSKRKPNAIKKNW